MNTNNYEETKKFFKELFKDENILLKSIKNTTITPEHPPEQLGTFAKFNPFQISEDEMKAALIRMSIMDCSGPNRNGRIYSKEAITKAWDEFLKVQLSSNNQYTKNLEDC